MDCTTLYLKAKLENFDCWNIEPFDILINTPPVLATTTLLETNVCDTDNNGVEYINVSDLDIQVLQGLSSNEHTVSYYYSEGDRLNQTNILGVNTTLANGTTFYAEVTDLETGCSTYLSLKTRMQATPRPSMDSVVPICGDEPATLWLENFEPTDTVEWSTGETVPIINVTQMGSYWAIVTNQMGCSTRVTTQVIKSGPAIVQDISVTSFTTDNTITVTVQGDGDYLYSLDGGLPQKNPTFREVTTGLHTITITDILGCAAVVREDIMVLNYPRYFSPNGDGFNDTWRIENLEEYEVSQCMIFDRKGRLMKKFDSRSDSWDGTLNGTAVDEDDYWFEITVELPKRPVNVKGHFSLRRN